MKRSRTDHPLLTRAMRRRDDLPEDDLLRLAAKGDEEAFVCLYRRHQGGIYRYALRMTGRSSAAEEITQEAFMALVREPMRYDVARGELGAFLFGITRNLVRKHLGRRREEISLDAGQWGESEPLAARLADGETADPGFLFARDETVTQVRDAVMRLPEEYREALVLCELEEKSYEEAAKLLECPVGTVRSRLHRGRALLLARLEILRGQSRRVAAQ
jgi:RNA polymerase sigma-70 factor, ECF subfamily